MFSIDLHEDNDASDIINDSIVFFPFLSGGPYQRISCSFGRVLYKEWPNDFGNLFVFQELPDSVTSYYDEFVVLSQLVLFNFYVWSQFSNF
jgi:hypothetical protein